MPGHDDFEELCALAAAGQLSGAELSEFNSHLKMCPGCRAASDDFALILGQLPTVDEPGSADDLALLQSDSYRERFLARAEAEGIHFPAEVRGKGPRKVLTFAPPRRWAWAAVAIAAAVLVVVALWRFDTRQPAGDVAVTIAYHPIATAPAPTVVASKVSEDNSPEAERRIRTLQQEVSALSDTIVAVSRERDSYRNQTDGDKGVLTQLNQRIEQLQQSLARNQEELDQARSERGQTVATLVEQQSQIADLKEQLKVRDAAIEQERQLSAAAKDVRELMGARNLHIIDVADVDDRGRARKAFGRAFFVENTSLIFYAFDLSAAAQNRKVAFQAWGQREGSHAKPRNLGIFRLDDHVQRRWVLRVDDPKLLAGIDSLFVTVESQPQADRPSGRKLVYAYLGTEPNHP